MIDLPHLPTFTGKGLLGTLFKDGVLHPAEDSRGQTIFILFTPPKPGLLGKPLSVEVTGDARLVKFEPPEAPLKAGETFQIEIEWIPKKQAFDNQMRLSAEYLVKMDVIAPARMGVVAR